MRLRLNPNLLHVELAPSQMFLYVFGELDVVKHFNNHYVVDQVHVNISNFNGDIKTKNFCSLLKLVYNKKNS